MLSFTNKINGFGQYIFVSLLCLRVELREVAKLYLLLFLYYTIMVTVIRCRRAARSAASNQVPVQILSGKESSNITSLSHPANKRGLFRASHQSAHTAGLNVADYRWCGWETAKPILTARSRKKKKHI